mmetsp:Transcript_26359/g.61490  ORF Transcript_26359/g.61490 Transcript_26359/m.61490 type:complete len:217 (-) Transcript_26359:659-1309(-)
MGHPPNPQPWRPVCHPRLRVALPRLEDGADDQDPPRVRHRLHAGEPLLRLQLAGGPAGARRIRRLLHVRLLGQSAARLALSEGPRVDGLLDVHARARCVRQLPERQLGLASGLPLLAMAKRRWPQAQDLHLRRVYCPRGVRRCGARRLAALQRAQEAGARHADRQGPGRQGRVNELCSPYRRREAGKAKRTTCVHRPRSRAPGSDSALDLDVRPRP